MRGHAREQNRVPGVEFYACPVDARHIPADLEGFRTIFSTFHHFNPEAARAMLADAVNRHQGIAVFEAAKSSFRTMVATAAVPFLCWRVTPHIRPFRWSRILWTYLLPIVPFTLFVDGILSCMRAYSPEDLRELTDGLGRGCIIDGKSARERREDWNHLSDRQTCTGHS